MSPGRTASRRRSPTANNSLSPIEWPRLSFTVLKPSRSSTITPIELPSRAWRASACSRRFAKRERLASSVSASWNARCRSSRSRSLRSVTSWIDDSMAVRPLNSSRWAVIETSIDSAVLQHVAPGNRAVVQVLRDRDLVQEGVAVLRRADVGHAHVEELGAAVAVVRDRGRVDFEEPVVVDVEHPHRLRVLEEQLAEARLLLAERMLGAAEPVGDPRGGFTEQHAGGQHVHDRPGHGCRPASPIARGAR